MSMKIRGRSGMWIALLVCFASGSIFGHIISSRVTAMGTESFLDDFYPLRLPSDDTPLIRPLVAYESPEATSLEEYSTLKELVQGVIQEHTKTGIRNASIYYRNLSTGRWIGINQGATYHPASLLKIPVMIACFKQAESDPALLKTRIRYTPVTGGNAFEVPSSLKSGTTYTIYQLIERMIIDSDNGATFTLLNRINEKTLREVYTDIGIEDPGENSASYKISTKTYALFFRILYNATYLSTKFSQEALDLLSRATYANGLRAGVPNNMTIAHKFGEHVSEGTTADGVELHDCGIVYHPETNYLLCVMTHANDVASAEAFIKGVSQTVYESGH